MTQRLLRPLVTAPSCQSSMNGVQPSDIGFGVWVVLHGIEIGLSDPGGSFPPQDIL